MLKKIAAFFRAGFALVTSTPLYLAHELLVFAPAFVFGIPVAYVAARSAKTATRNSKHWPGRPIVVYQNAILQAWVGNEEDGLCSVDWAQKNRGDTLAQLYFSWYLRNPVTNLRFTFLGITLDPKRVGSVGAHVMPADRIPGWFIAWQGLRAGVRWQSATRGIWLGWKVKPEDAFGVSPDDYRSKGCDVASQYIRFAP